MSENRTAETVYAPRNNNRPKLLCRLLGHRWKAAHRKDLNSDGQTIWVYLDDVCERCYCTDWRMPHGPGQ